MFSSLTGRVGTMVVSMAVAVCVYGVDLYAPVAGQGRGVHAQGTYSVFLPSVVQVGVGARVQPTMGAGYPAPVQPTPAPTSGAVPAMCSALDGTTYPRLLTLCTGMRASSKPGFVDSVAAQDNAGELTPRLSAREAFALLWWAGMTDEGPIQEWQYAENPPGGLGWRTDDRELWALDLDLADAVSLDVLPGVGPTLAGRILAGRPADGWAHPLQLRAIKGIGLTTLAKLLPCLYW